MIPAFLTGAVAVVVTAKALHSFLESDSAADQRAAYIAFARRTLTARGSEGLTTDEVTEATQVLKDLKRLKRTVREGWKSDGDKDAFARVLRYLPVGRAKIALEKGKEAVDAGLKSVIDALEGLRPR